MIRISCSIIKKAVPNRRSWFRIPAEPFNSPISMMLAVSLASLSCKPPVQEPDSPPQSSSGVEEVVSNESWTEKMYLRSGKDLIPFHHESYNTPDGWVNYLHQIDRHGDILRSLIFRIPKSEDDGTYEVTLQDRSQPETKTKSLSPEETSIELDQIIATLRQKGFKELYDRYNQGQWLREFPHVEGANKHPYDDTKASNPVEYERNEIARINETNLFSIVNLIKHYRQTLEAPQAGPK